jgi:hypothetical protein
LNPREAPALIRGPEQAAAQAALRPMAQALMALKSSRFRLSPNLPPSWPYFG